jgi:hypothetical protein
MEARLLVKRYPDEVWNKTSRFSPALMFGESDYEFVEQDSKIVIYAIKTEFFCSRSTPIFPIGTFRVQIGEALQDESEFTNDDFSIEIRRPLKLNLSQVLEVYGMSLLHFLGIPVGLWCLKFFTTYLANDWGDSSQLIWLYLVMFVGFLFAWTSTFSKIWENVAERRWQHAIEHLL